MQFLVAVAAWLLVLVALSVSVCVCVWMTEPCFSVFHQHEQGGRRSQSSSAHFSPGGQRSCGWSASLLMASLGQTLAAASQHARPKRREMLCSHSSARNTRHCGRTRATRRASDEPPAQPPKADWTPISSISPLDALACDCSRSASRLRPKSGRLSAHPHDSRESKQTFRSYSAEERRVQLLVAANRRPMYHKK